MRFIDLTHLLNSDISVYPGTEKPIFEQANMVEKDGFAEQKITMNTHTGTHMDAPAHMLVEGKSLDQFSADSFFGKAISIDCTGFSGANIEIEDLLSFEKKIEKVDFVLLRTDWSKKWKTSEYFGAFPTLSAAACEWLTRFNLKGIGLDVISIDPVGSTDLTNHHIVFHNGMLIIENLTNLSELGGDYFKFLCFPLKIEKADGSPIRAVAIFE